jgi:hypothetical protein
LKNSTTGYADQEKLASSRHAGRARFSVKSNQITNHCPTRNREGLRSRPEQLYEFVSHKAGFKQLQSCLWNVLFGLTVETSAVGPVNPGLPKARHRTAKPAAWSSVFEASNDTSRLHHPA